jgi:hypothetical protein
MDTPILLAAFTSTVSNRKVAAYSLTTGISAVGAFLAILTAFGGQLPGTAIANLQAADAKLNARIDTLATFYRGASDERKELQRDVDLLLRINCRRITSAELIEACDNQAPPPFLPRR